MASVVRFMIINCFTVSRIITLPHGWLRNHTPKCYFFISPTFSLNPLHFVNMVITIKETSMILMVLNHCYANSFRGHDAFLQFLGQKTSITVADILVSRFGDRPKRGICFYNVTYYWEIEVRDCFFLQERNKSWKNWGDWPNGMHIVSHFNVCPALLLTSCKYFFVISLFRASWMPLYGICPTQDSRFVG